MTETEKQFYRRKILMLKDGGFLIEPIEKYLERIYAEAAVERIKPTEWYRFLSRVLQAIPGPLDADEFQLIRDATKRKDIYTEYNDGSPRIMRAQLVGDADLQRVMQEILKHRRLKELKSIWTKVQQRSISDDPGKPKRIPQLDKYEQIW